MTDERISLASDSYSFTEEELGSQSPQEPGPGGPATPNSLGVNGL